MTEPWFRPKRYGYGAGLPIHWKGWALMTATVAVLLLAVALTVVLVPGRPDRSVMLLVAGGVTLPFALVARNRTRGGWRWRWGED